MSETESRIPVIQVEPTKLPSRGVSYPPDVKISYKTYSFGDVKKSSLSVLSHEKTLEASLQGILVEGMDKDQLTINDAFYIALMRKLSSFGTGIQFKVPYVCRSCKKPSEHIFRVMDINFKDLNSSITSMPITIENLGCDDNGEGGKTVEFGLMTVKDYRKIHSKDMKEYFNKIDSTALYAILVRNMSFEEAYEFISGLTDLDSIEILDDLDKLLDHSVKPLKATCIREVTEDGKTAPCGTENYIRLEGIEALLRPFRESGRTNKHKIRFGAE